MQFYQGMQKHNLKHEACPMTAGNHSNRQPKLARELSEAGSSVEGRSCCQQDLFVTQSQHRPHYRKDPVHQVRTPVDIRICITSEQESLGCKILQSMNSSYLG